MGSRKTGAHLCRDKVRKESSCLPCEQPKRNLLLAFVWIFVPFSHLQSPEGAASAKVTAAGCFVGQASKEETESLSLSLNEP